MREPSDLRRVAWTSALLALVMVAAVGLLTHGSASASGHTATRHISEHWVAPGDEVVITISATGYGALGQVVETLPPGFAYVESSISEGTRTDGQSVVFTLLGEESFTYTVAVSNIEGVYSFSGIVKDLDKEERAVTGHSEITVSASPPPTPTPTPTPVPTATPSPIPTPTLSPDPTATPSPVPTPTPPATETPTSLPTSTAGPALSPTPTATHKTLPTATPSPLPSPTSTPTAIPTATSTASPTPTPSATPGVAPAQAPAVESPVPAGRPTVTPPPESGSIDQGPMLVWAILLALVGAALVAGLAIALMYRRRRSSS